MVETALTADFQQRWRAMPAKFLRMLLSSDFSRAVGYFKVSPWEPRHCMFSQEIGHLDNAGGASDNIDARSANLQIDFIRRVTDNLRVLRDI